MTSITNPINDYIAINIDVSNPLEKNQTTSCAKIAALKTASYLTEPICKVREYYYSLYTLSQSCVTTLQKVLRVVILVLGIAIYAL